MEEVQVAWRAMPYRAPVLDAAGEPIGTAESLLGDEEDDIFHGLAVKLHGSGRLVEIAADRIERITTVRAYSNVPREEVDQLPDYEQSKWFHIEWGGLFRKHPDWRGTGEG